MRGAECQEAARGQTEASQSAVAQRSAVGHPDQEHCSCPDAEISQQDHTNCSHRTTAFFLPAPEGPR
jgi:hypothetical protein